MVDEDSYKEVLSHESLLAIGIISSSGTFQRGEVVSLANQSGRIFARGLINISSLDIKKVIGVASNDLSQILGYACDDEVIHCDNLVTV